jgi:pimeloyl-ACP methyl ester carboxylesterase
MASHRFIGWCATLLLTLCASAQAAQLTGDPQPDPQYPPAMAELTILSNGSRMPALLYQANGAGPHPTVLLLHGFPGNEKNLDIAQVLRRDGFNVLFFHYRGAWGAEGDYSINQLDDDVLAALAFLRNPANAAALRINSDRLSLLGQRWQRAVRMRS